MREGRGHPCSPVPFSQGQRGGSPPHTPLSLALGSPGASVGRRGTFSLWFDERHSLVFVLIAEDRPCLPGMDRLRTPHPRPKHAGSLVPASETLPFMHLFGKYLSTASPLCPLLEGQRRGQEPCSIRGGRLGKRPSPLQQFSV